MKKDVTRQAIAMVVIGIVAAFFAGAYLATKYVSPCVCIYAEQSRVN